MAGRREAEIGSREVVKRNDVLEGDSVEKVRGGDEYKQAAKVMLIVSGAGHPKTEHQLRKTMRGSGAGQECM